MSKSIPQKQCSQCKQFFPATTQYFYKNSFNRDGLLDSCKVCRSAYMKQRRIEKGDQIRAAELARRNQRRDEVNAVHRKWRDAHLEQVRTYHRSYYAKRREWNSERKKRAYQANRQKFLRRNHLYRITHAGEKRAYEKRYYRTHTQQALLRRRLRIARLRRVPGRHTIHDIRVLYEQQAGQCIYCHKALHEKYEVDHIIPLTREGSSNDRENLALSCRSCNRRKHTKTPEEWLRYRREIELS